MGKTREHMTVEQIKAQVEEEIPYVVGQGRMSIIKRERRMKILMRRHGHTTDVSRFEPEWDPIPRAPLATPSRIERLA